MADGSQESDLRREVHALKEVVSKQREEINQLKEDGAASIVESLGLNSPTGRRQALKYGAAGAGLPALLAYAASQEGQADAVAADVGTEADPWRKVWTHEIESGDGASELTITGTANVGSLTAEDGTIGGVPILGMPGSPSSAGLTLGGGWTTVDANQPTFLLLEILAQTDGSSSGQVIVEVDFSGGTSADISPLITADLNIGSGGNVVETLLIPLPAGAQVNINNSSDPNAGNNIFTQQKYVVSS